MKRYYIYHYRNFGNTYHLYWAETPEQIKKAEEFCDRISKKEAYGLCAEENRRRKYDPSFAYYATNVIYPIGYTRADPENDPRIIKKGYLILRK